MGTVFAACVVIVAAGVAWFHIVRPILEDFGVIGVSEGNANTVNRSQIVMSPPVPLTTPDKQPDGPDRQTDKQTDAVSVGDQWLARLKVDKTRAAWIGLMLYIGYSVGDIRGLLKGDNVTIGAEIQAARNSPDSVDADTDPDVHITPIAGRRTRKEFYPGEPELEFKPPH